MTTNETYTTADLKTLINPILNNEVLNQTEQGNLIREVKKILKSWISEFNASLDFSGGFHKNLNANIQIKLQVFGVDSKRKSLRLITKEWVIKTAKELTRIAEAKKEARNQKETFDKNKRAFEDRLVEELGISRYNKEFKFLNSLIVYKTGLDEDNAIEIIKGAYLNLVNLTSQVENQLQAL